MIKNRNMVRDAKIKMVISEEIDMSSDTAQESLVLFDPDRDIKIIDIRTVFTVAGDTGSVQAIEVGTAASATKYANFTITNTVAATAKGTSQKATLASTDLLAAGTGLFARRYTSAAATNTAQLRVAVFYELVDRRNAGVA